MQTFMKQNEHFYFELNDFKYIGNGYIMTEVFNIIIQ